MTDQQEKPLDLSFVFPCLNEEATLGACIEQVKESFVGSEVRYEIVVADNGSTDRSREIAEENGARVVPVPVRGYGAALKGGIQNAAGKYVMFADADSTYMLEHAAPLYQKAVDVDADMAIASRMHGTIEPGAMPTLHRYVGTPVLTSLINLLFRGSLSDCNSGFRCIRKAAYEDWFIRADGMEFASELLIKALKSHAIIVEIPSGLRPDVEGREAHLRTWRDGMRHLLFILSERPQLFEYAGLATLFSSSLLQAAAAFIGPVQVLKLSIFDHHSQALLLLGALMGAQIYLFSCVIFLRGSEEPTQLTKRIIELDEGVLFFVLVGFYQRKRAARAAWIVLDLHPSRPLPLPTVVSSHRENHPERNVERRSAELCSKVP